jgi:hypothetical protein
VKDSAEKLGSELRHALLDPGSDRSNRGIGGEQRVILQVPADILSVLIRERKPETARDRNRRLAIAFEPNFDSVLVGSV